MRKIIEPAPKIILSDTTHSVDDLMRFILDARLVGNTSLMPIVCRGRECTEARLVKRCEVLELELDIPGTEQRQP